ncbi:MAG: PD-(D/E)XK nuclease family protein [Xanthobacteraceae bacterium]|nr:PD-(D/E)XK nuclease family protein [Xanthobacteraceae bacterium]
MKIQRHSPSSLNLFCASPSMFVLERIMGIRQPVGAPAHRGTAVEDGVTAGLMDPTKPLDDCYAVAIKKYDAITALSGDKRREEYRDTIPAMVKTALEELRPYGVPSHCQQFVEWKPDGLKYPIVGYLDYRWEHHGIVVDLKTTGALPSSIKIPHARQVALYSTQTGDNVDARLAYVTPKKRATYQLENTRDHLNALHQIALRCEAFLAMSNDPEFFTSITCPDVESFYWGGNARQLAYKHWNI